MERGGKSDQQAACVLDEAILEPYQDLFEDLGRPQLRAWQDLLRAQILLASKSHGDAGRWQHRVHALPKARAERVLLDQSWVTLEGRLGEAERKDLLQTLEALHPWRKGPFDLFGIRVDTEWRSDWKWDRLQGAITPLEGRWVLDVGCGSGYHVLRMLGAGAHRVIGIEPMLLSVCQFLAIKRLAGALKADVLPVGIDEVPKGLRAFDTVFSMGVLYHRRSPIDHLLELQGLLRPGGELVIETLIIEGREGAVLTPQERYAQMRNVWFIPSPDTLRRWLERTGYLKIRLVDVSETSFEEQRRTPWMRFHSLADFLKAEEPSETLEGYPRPRRAIFLAEAPRLS